jgi:aspartate/methionine/tyrosine aminotransferase
MAQERCRQGLPVYDFGLGETKGDLAPHVREAAERAYREGRTMYGDPAGIEELRLAALEWLGLSETDVLESVIVTTGAKQSRFNIFLATCNPGDCVLRIGWTVAPADVGRAMANFESHYTSGPSIPAQHAALAAITEAYDVELREALRRKRDLRLKL